MGEYAKFQGSSIKIGTCESMYYLRADQCDKVDGYDFDYGRDVIRFRFPFPDEDHIEPGGFEDYDRGIRIPGWTLPAEFDDHGQVQFTAPQGYNLCVPCPESFGAPQGFGPIPVALKDGGTIGVHRNGWRGGPQIAFQGYREGHLATIVKCGSCGSMWRLDRARAAEVADAFLDESERKEYRRDVDGLEFVHSTDTRREFHTIAERILAGYVGAAV